jgi:hypothetical protein
MITNAEILQANATLIAGVLIFLTIAPFSGSVVRQIMDRKAVLWTVIDNDGILPRIEKQYYGLSSTTTVFFLADTLENKLALAKFFTLTGILGILIATIIVLRDYLGLREHKREAKRFR